MRVMRRVAALLSSLLLAPGFLLDTGMALQNGAALLPPLGWLSWQRYNCATDCANATANECFNEGLIRDTADAMVSLGYKAAGWEYVSLDDCWQAKERVNGRVVADPVRFPSGIKALADYVHSRGLKLGLYTAVGTGTCAMKGELGLGCENSAIPQCETARQDLEQFVDWGIDSLKVDGCSPTHSTLNASYAIIGSHLLNASRRRGLGPVLYNPSCLNFNFPRQLRELATIGNQWRFTHDITDTWESIATIIEHLGAGQPKCLPGPLPENCTGWHYPVSSFCESFCVERDAFRAAAGRGSWADPDALLVGNTACSVQAQKNGMSCRSITHAEEQTQMALWSMASAPLQMSNDLQAVPAASRAILLNREIITIQSDPLGRMSFRFLNNKTSGAQGWKKELVGGDMAVALVNMGIADDKGATTTSGATTCTWNHTRGGYVDTCGGQKGDLWCGDFGSVEVAQNRCCADPACVGFSIATVPIKSGPANHGCLKRGEPCGYSTNVDFDGYQRLGAAPAPAPAPPITVGFDFSEVGFTSNTHVRVRDLFKGQDLGVFYGSFSTAMVATVAGGIESHGVLMLRLSYEPQYGVGEF